MEEIYAELGKIWEELSTKTLHRVTLKYNDYKIHLIII